MSEQEKQQKARGQLGAIGLIFLTFMISIHIVIIPIMMGILQDHTELASNIAFATFFIVYMFLTHSLVLQGKTLELIKAGAFGLIFLSTMSALGFSYFFSLVFN